MAFSGQKVAFGVTFRVTFRVTLGETPKVTFWSLSSDFEFFGVSGVLGGRDFLQPAWQNPGSESEDAMGVEKRGGRKTSRRTPAGLMA